MFVQKGMQNLRREGGITLIALIITIIILVILAAVSINAAYNSGIINYAVNGTQNYLEAAKEEQNRVAKAEGLMESVMGNLDKVQNSINAGERAGQTKYYISGGKIATIPEGFVVSKNANESSIAKGLVIYRIPETGDNGLSNNQIKTINWNALTVTKGETEIELKKAYDQFVWIPVDTPYVTAAEITNIIANNISNVSGDTNNQKAINYLISQGKYPMAVQLDNGTDYRGILYNFTNNSGTITIASYGDFSTAASDSYDYNVNGYKQYYREPGMVSYDYGINYLGTGITSPNNINLTQNALQQEYNKRVKSVEENGGFWVGRYETSGMHASNDNSANVEVVAGNANGDTYKISNINWYRMYAQQKAYVNGLNSNYVGGMVSGAEWDQMMIYLTKAGKNVTVINSVEHNNDNFTIKPYQTGGTNYTDALKDTATITIYNDIWNNIYDLEGNVREWTIEANSTYSRVRRGGSYYDAESARNRFYLNPSLTGMTLGSRVSLYVK